MIINELVTKFSFNTGTSFKQLNQGLKFSVKISEQSAQAIKKAQESALKAGVASQRAAHETILKMQRKRVDESIRLMAAEKKAAKDMMSERMRGAGGGGMAAIGGMVGGIGAGAIVGKGMTALGEYQTGLNRLRVEYQDVNKAASVYNDLVKFAAKTPFELPEVVDFYAQMQAQGFNLTYDDLTALGDLASASNKDLSTLANAMLSVKRGHADMVDNFLGLGGTATDGMIEATMEVKGFGKVVKKFDTKDVGAIKDFFVGAGKRKNVMGMMAEQSKTVPGMLSTAADNAKMLLVAGFRPLEGSISKAFLALGKFTDKMKPLAVSAGVFASYHLPRIFKGIADNLPIINAGLFLMTARFIGLQKMMISKWALETAAAVRTLGVAAWFANGGLGLLPTIIGGTILVLGTLIADFVYFFNTGDSMLLKLTERWTGLHDWLKNAYDMNRIFWGAVLIGCERIGNYVSTHLGPIFENWGSGVKTIVTWLIDNLSIVKKILDGIGFIANSGMFEKFAGWISGFEDTGGGGGGGNSNQGILGAAKNFAAGAPNQSAADKWAKSNATMNGMKVKQLYIQGVACDISTEKVVGLAGADNAVLEAMTGEVPTTLKNLLDRGLAEVVPRSKLQGGELFYEWSKKYGTWGHTGVVGEGGKSLIHASNSSGGQIGMGQRFTETSNYLSDRAMFIRIKDEHMKNKPMQVSMTFNGNMGPRQVRQSAQDGLLDAINRNQPRRVPAGGDKVT